MNAERRHRVSFTPNEVLAALKAARPTCLTTQAIPAVGPASGPTVSITAGTLDFIWYRPGHPTTEKE